MSETTALLSKEEFCARFKAHMIAQVGRADFDDGGSIEVYADETAPTYIGLSSTRRERARRRAPRPTYRIGATNRFDQKGETK